MNKKELGALIIDGTDDFYRVAKSILKEDADCQDAVQEAVSKAFAKIDTLREKKYAKTWFIRILLNECYAILRKRNRETICHEEISNHIVTERCVIDVTTDGLVLSELRKNCTISEIQSAVEPTLMISPVLKEMEEN